MHHFFHPALHGLFIGALTGATALNAEDQWGTTPLGAPVEVSRESPPVRQKAGSSRKTFPATGEGIVLLKKGSSPCPLIIPADPSPAAERAASLLQTVLGEMTGAEFPIYTEDALQFNEGEISSFIGRNTWRQGVWIGDTAEARRQGLSASDLLPEGFKLVTRDPGLFLLGNDSSRSQPDLNGTYFAAVDLLERHLGVRWLWPGSLGTVIPNSDELHIPALNEQDEPALAQRIIRNMSLNRRAETGLNLLKRDEEPYKKTLEESSTWRSVQKLGSSLRLEYRHAFHDWFEKYGEDHPEWFALQPNGSRLQTSPRPRLCKSNPEVAREAARQVIEQYKLDPAADSISISPNDGSGSDHFCMCEECRKLDPANAPPVELLFSKDGKRFYESYPSLTDRTVTFYNRIATEVAKTHPDIRLGVYAYSAYRDAPLATALHPSIVVAFVGLNYENDHLREIDVNRWNAWSTLASRMVLRPNALHGGQALPFLMTRRLAEDVRHCHETGMIATDFDSLLGHWSTQGLNYYVLAKVLWDPSVNVDTLVRDYCEKGFGPAAPKVEEYFHQIEAGTTEVAKQASRTLETHLRDEDDDTPRTERSAALDAFHQAYWSVFTPEKIASLRNLLTEADELAASDETIRHRIEFLRRGLDYADRYRAVSDSNESLETRTRWLAWFREIYDHEPHAVNSVFRAWRLTGAFRHLE